MAGDLTAQLHAEWTREEASQPEALLMSERLDDVLVLAAARAAAEAEEVPATVAESTRPTVAVFAGEPWI